MGIQFRKRLKLFPGVWLNLSKTGASVSAGVKGFTVNSGRGKTRTTASLPGSGLSYVTTTPTSTVNGKPRTRPMFWLALILALVGLVYVLKL